MLSFNFWIRATSICLVVTTLASCAELQPKDLAKYLRQNGWTYVDVPRQLLGPGAIVTISKESGITYRGELSSCIDDQAVVTPKSGPVALNGAMNKAIQFSADAFVNYQGVQVGPEFNKVGTYKLVLKDTIEYAIDDIKLRNWLEANAHNLTQACRDYLGYANAGQGAKNVFILVNVLGAGKYEYSFFDKSGSKIEVSAAKLSQFVTPKAGFDFSVTSDGNLTSDKPVFLAFKRGVPASPVGMGAAADETATQEMQGYLRARSLIE